MFLPRAAAKGNRRSGVFGFSAHNTHSHTLRAPTLKSGGCVWGAHSTADMYAHVGTSLAKMTPRRIPGTATGTGEGVLLDSRGRRRNLGLGGEVSEREGQVLFAGDAIKRERDGCQSSRAHTHATHMQLRRGFGRRCDSLYVLLLLWMHGKKKVHDLS